MPVYEYKCSECDECFEIKQSYHDKPVTVCHRCGSEARRVFKPAPIIFKGSGFYVTDYATDKEKNAETRKKGSKPSTSAAASEIAKSETSPADNKADTKPAKKEESGGS